MKTRVVTSHLPAELAEKLDGLAERLERPKGWIVKEAIASYVALEEERRRTTLDALADVKAGRTHEHAEVEAWAGTFGEKKTPGARELLARLRKYRGRMPADFKFDRIDANKCR